MRIDWRAGFDWDTRNNCRAKSSHSWQKGTALEFIGNGVWVIQGDHESTAYRIMKIIDGKYLTAEVTAEEQILNYMQRS